MGAVTCGKKETSLTTCVCLLSSAPTKGACGWVDIRLPLQLPPATSVIVGKTEGKLASQLANLWLQKKNLRLKQEEGESLIFCPWPKQSQFLKGKTAKILIFLSDCLDLSSLVPLNISHPVWTSPSVPRAKSRQLRERGGASPHPHVSADHSSCLFLTLPLHHVFFCTSFTFTERHLLPEMQIFYIQSKKLCDFVPNFVFALIWFSVNWYILK